jgi:hypothetical protein
MERESGEGRRLVTAFVDPVFGFFDSEVNMG